MSYLYKNHSSEFIIEPTKYSKYYCLIVERALNEQRTKLKKDHISYVYYENHHILPSSLFPEFSKLKDNPWNSVLLTAREHFLVHALIYKHFKCLNHQWMYKTGHAFKAMSKFKIDVRYNSKSYCLYKLNLKHSDETKQKLKELHTGKSLSDEHKQKIKNSTHNRSHSEETKQKLKEMKIGLKHSEETKQKISSINKGRKLSDETKKKMSEKKLSEKTRNKISESLKKPISVHGTIYNSLSEAVEITKISSHCLRKMAKDPCNNSVYWILKTN